MIPSTLEFVDGPECPTCGCRDSTLVRATTHWGERAERRQCRHCGRTWTYTPDAAGESEEAKPSPPHPLTPSPPDPDTPDSSSCPGCGSGNVIVTSTQKRVRYYRCRACGGRFKRGRPGAEGPEKRPTPRAKPARRKSGDL